MKIRNSRLILATLTQTAVAPNAVMIDISDTGDTVYRSDMGDIGNKGSLSFTWVEFILEHLGTLQVK